MKYIFVPLLNIFITAILFIVVLAACILMLLWTFSFKDFSYQVKLDEDQEDIAPFSRAHKGKNNIFKSPVHYILGCRPERFYTILFAAILMAGSSNGFCQFKIEKKDIAPMSCTLAAGFLQGTREQVLYHPNALFKQFPTLNRKFWDIRQGHRWDANHWLKTGITTLFTAAIVFKFGDKKKKWYYYVWDGFKYYLPYKLGFFLAYNVTFKNKITL